jgi:hypothetical protein
MSRRLTGAALNARVIAELRDELSEEYGLPMDDYDGEIVDRYDLGSDMQPILAVTFTRRVNDRTIQVSDIHPTDNGEIDQRSAAVELR